MWRWLMRGLCHRIQTVSIVRLTGVFQPSRLGVQIPSAEIRGSKSRGFAVKGLWDRGLAEKGFEQITACAHTHADWFHTEREDFATWQWADGIGNFPMGFHIIVPYHMCWLRHSWWWSWSYHVIIVSSPSSKCECSQVPQLPWMSVGFPMPQKVGNWETMADSGRKFHCSGNILG